MKRESRHFRLASLADTATIGELTMDLVAPKSNRTITKTVGIIPLDIPSTGIGNGFLSFFHLVHEVPREITHCCGAAGSDACGIVRIQISWSLNIV